MKSLYTKFYYCFRIYQIGTNGILAFKMHHIQMEPLFFFSYCEEEVMVPFHLQTYLLVRSQVN